MPKLVGWRYVSYHTTKAWSVTLIPAIYFSRERDYVKVKFGTGKEPDAVVWRFDFAWLFWSFGVKAICV